MAYSTSNTNNAEKTQTVFRQDWVYPRSSSASVRNEKDKKKVQHPDRSMRHYFVSIGRTHRDARGAQPCAVHVDSVESRQIEKNVFRMLGQPTSMYFSCTVRTAYDITLWKRKGFTERKAHPRKLNHILVTDSDSDEPSCSLPLTHEYT